MSTLFDISRLRWPAPNTSVIFSDESSTKQDFFVLGGLYFWHPSDDYKNQIATFESELEALKTEHKLGTVKWQKVPTPGPLLDGYKALVKYLAERKNKIKFKCMIVDTQKYPLDHTTINDGDELIGYMRYYKLFLVDGIMKAQKGYFYDITIDDYSWRPKTGHDSVRLGKWVELRYRGYFKSDVRDPRRYRLSELKALDDKKSNILQMADLFAGAVAFCRNGGLERTSTVSTGRIELIEVIRKCYGGVRLDQYQQPRGPFVIWNFADPDDGPLPSLTARGNVTNYP
jgi:Protein of unknown function (DUF3800)